MRRVFPLVVALVFAIANIPVAHATADRDAVLDISFPVGGAIEPLTDTYNANRDGGARRHQATDLFGHKGQPLHAVMAGTVCFASGIDEPMPAYGYVLHLCSGDLTFVYSHLNNDSPGTDDGRGGPSGAYAPGIREGAQVARGQVIGYMGDSGNAEDTPTHLHFGIHDASFEDPALTAAPWRQHYRNPYPSLVAAQARGEVPEATIRLGSTGARVAEWQADLNFATLAGLRVDGDFGPATDAATRAFQLSAGVTVDGVVGPTTQAAMVEALRQRGLDSQARPGTSTPGTTAPGTTPVSGGSGSASGDGAAVAFPGRVLRLEVPMMRGDDVRAWQQQLRDRGVTGPGGARISVDGIYGPATDAASRGFQRAQGLTVDGLVGPRTWASAFAT